MRNLRAKSRFCGIAALLFFVPCSVVWAQEAVSTTSSSAATTSSSGATTDVSQTTTSSAAAGAAVSSQPSGAGLFSRSPVKITTTLLGGYDDNVNTVPGREEGSS